MSTTSNQLDGQDPRLDLSVARSRFSPLYVTAAIVEPLRYLFAKSTRPELKYHSDPKETGVIIAPFYQFTPDEAYKGKPRVLVNSGPFTYGKTGLSENLAEGQELYSSLGVRDDKYFALIQGNASIIVEATNDGTVDVVTDMVTTFLTWSRPHIAQTFGFKEFGLPLNVSECQIDREDREKFKRIISVPWTKETAWRLNEDAIKLKSFFLELVGES